MTSKCRKRAADQDKLSDRTTGFEPATLTLAKKETHLVRQDRCTPLSSLSPVSSSAQSVESARLQRLTFNALNLCEIDASTCLWPTKLEHGRIRAFCAFRERSKAPNV